VDVDPAKNTRDFPATNTRDFPVQHGAGDAFLVFGHHRRVAGTGFLGIAVISARAGMYTIEQFFLLNRRCLCGELDNPFFV
jgi:hypothetical protein